MFLGKFKTRQNPIKGGVKFCWKKSRIPPTRDRFFFLGKKMFFSDFLKKFRNFDCKKFSNFLAMNSAVKNFLRA